MKKAKGFMTVALILVLALLAYYYFINRDKGSDDPDNMELSQIDKMLGKDLENNYPVSAREVLTYFLNIQECYYNESPEESEVVKLAYQAMKLFDEELLKENEFDEYYENLQLEIEEYKSAERTIKKTIPDKAADIIYSDIEGVKYASINCIYYLSEGKNTVRVTTKYALRRDSEGRWKILGWDRYEPSEYEEE